MRLLAEQADVAERLEALRRDFAGIVTASEHTNADDEHDPEGATIAFERAQLHALIGQTAARLVEIDAALDRRETGEYASCRVCGQPIGVERLAVRPTATTCITCAR